MVNVSDKFLLKMKEIMKSNGMNPEDFVICIICRDVEGGVTLDFAIMPLYVFEDRKNPDALHSEKIPFRPFLLYKKLGCWIVSDNGAFFHLINSKITINEEGNVLVKKLPEDSKDNLKTFVGECLVEHMKNEKLTKKTLANYLKVSLYKLNKILKGTFNLSIKELLTISMEFEGTNKVSKYFVMTEKIVEEKSYDDLDDFF